MEVEVVIGTYDCAITGYSIELQKLNSRLQRKYQEKEHNGCVKAVACGNHYLATGGTDEVIKLYDVRKHTEIGTLLQHEGSIIWLAFHKDKLLLSAGEDGRVCVWKCGGGWDLVHSLAGHKYGVSCVSVHPSGRLALSVGRDRTLRTWDLQSGRGVFTQRLKIAAELVVWSKSGDHYLLNYGALVVVHEVKTGNPTASIDVKKQVNSVIFVKEDVLAVGSEHPYILLFSSQSRDILAKLEGHTHRVKALCLDSSGDFLFSAASNGTMKVWQLANPLSASRCVSSVESGSRITSMAIASVGPSRVTDTNNPKENDECTIIESDKFTTEMPKVQQRKAVLYKKRPKLSQKLESKLSSKKLSKLKRLG